MKAFKQISLRNESRWVWTYSSVLILLVTFVMFKPVFAQLEEKTYPEEKVDVVKEYDADGNLVRLDSVRSWIWSGNAYAFHELDSLLQGMTGDLKEFFPRNFDVFGFDAMPNSPPLHGFWQWNEKDSTAYSQLGEDFEERFREYFSEEFFTPGHFGHSHFPDFDSLDFQRPDFERFDDFFDESLEEQFNDFSHRFQQYQEEHRQLIDKYFHQPENE